LENLVKADAAQMQAFRVESRLRVPTSGRVETAHQLGIQSLTACETRSLFFLQGDLSLSDVETLSRELLADPVTETFHAVAIHEAQLLSETCIEVTLLPGVTDPAAENLVRAAHLLGITTLERAATGQAYILQGNLSQNDLQRLSVEVFSNPVIQRCAINAHIAPPFVEMQPSNDTVERIALYYANDATLLKISKERRLSLDLNEMRAIRDYFRSEGRDPTDAELETLAQTWSEHCVHKTFKAVIDYEGPDGQQTIDGLLKTYIRAATDKLNKPFVRSAFVDNAGIIAFDDHFDLAFKVETHNHPSALEPFGGANTGVGGVVRDVLGVSARPIANTDVLCFGLPDTAHEDLPSGVLHPRRIADGVIAGVEDYGNKMGIPTVNGAILYDKGYTANPLVFCGCLGILPRGSHASETQAGDLIIVVGGRTGRDGIRGATFSSMEMDTTTSEIAGSSVQIGHPIHEKQTQEVVLRARDEKLYNAITDCGAGGLSSAVGEMGAKVGATVKLENVPLKYPGLRPWEIWLSEAQERMVFAVPQEKWARLKEICDGQDIEAVCIGTFEATGRLRLTYEETLVGDMAMGFVHDGIPQRRLKAEWKIEPPSRQDRQEIQENVDLTQTLLKMLAQPNVRSKEDVIRLYDHEVQGGGVVKPLTGVDNHGPSDAAVIVPLDTQLNVETKPTKGVALSNGVNPAYGDIDPYAMAWAAVDEAMRNLVAVGADPDQVAILDNFCWGNPNLPDRLGSLVRAAQGCHDAALAYGVPFISGKDSLNNEYSDADGTKHAIPGTLVISAMGIVPDVTKTVTMDLKAAGNYLYIIGETRDEMGGSLYNQLHGIESGTVPQAVPNALDIMRRLHQAIDAGLVQSCHDVSEGGIAVALAEMCIAGRMGAEVYVHNIPVSTLAENDARKLFVESSCRFIVEVTSGKERAFMNLFEETQNASLGLVRSEGVMTVKQPLFKNENPVLIEINVSELEFAWRGHISTPTTKSIEQPKITTSAHSQELRVSSAHTSTPRVLILHANGSNRDREAALACQLAGGAPEIVHVNQLLNGERKLADYHMLILPGGFSYGDDLGAGTVWAMDVNHRLGEDVRKFVASGRPTMGICNGFQALVKAGILPGDVGEQERSVTLTRNELAHFECRWVYLQPNAHSHCLFTQGLEEIIYCPVAHGEGRVAVNSDEVGQALWTEGYAALTYVDANTQAASYPFNPNGSVFGIAGLTNREGNVLGLMPHPEDHVFNWQHPRWHRGERGMSGLHLFENGIKNA
jgi:phosphoribosylformylglycinamidine synthase II/phosphoribosylformylglycinamidine synthase I